MSVSISTATGASTSSCFLAGCKRRIGFARGRKSILLTDAVRVAGIKHHIFHYCDLLKPLGIFCLDFKMEFPLDDAQAAAAAEKFLAPANLDDYIVLAPGGAANVKEEMESRRWPVEHFSALAGLLLGAGEAGGPAGQRRRRARSAPASGRSTRGWSTSPGGRPWPKRRRC